MNSTNQIYNLEEEEKTSQIQTSKLEEKKKIKRKRQRRSLYYKQIPMNMAEARREIVTALKLHRASTKPQKQFKQFFPFRFQSQKLITNPTIYPHLIPTSQILHFPTQTLGLKLSFDNHFSTNFNTNSSYFCSPVSCSVHEEEGKLEIEKVVDFKDLEIDEQSTLFGFDNVETEIEFPDWLSMNDDLLGQHSNYRDFVQDSDLSCLGIGEIEDVDGDWLA